MVKANCRTSGEYQRTRVTTVSLAVTIVTLACAPVTSTSTQNVPHTRNPPAAGVASFPKTSDSTDIVESPGSAASAPLALPSESSTVPEQEKSTGPTRAEAAMVPGWLGIHMRQTDEGVVVANVLRGSPAATAGLESGDRVLRIGSRVVSVTSDVSTFVQDQPVGTRVSLDVRRGKKTRLLSATIVAKPEREAAMRADLVGREAPSISHLKTVRGTLVPSWTHLKGHVVVLYFWATWCVACRALSPTLNEWYEELAPTGVDILGITMDPFEETSRASQYLEFPTYVDESGGVTLSYQGTALPTLIIVDKSSVTREVMAGLDFERLSEIKRLIKELRIEPVVP
jgi:thiol-disulfide isomerase/thioredoxin